MYYILSTPSNNYILTLASGGTVVFTNSPVLLEDFSGASIRKTDDGTEPIWSAYLGQNPDQSGYLNTASGTFTNVVGPSVPFSGYSTGGNTSSTFNDTTKNFTVPYSNQQLTYANLFITGGTGSGEIVGLYGANSATQLSNGTWGTIPDATSAYFVGWSAGLYFHFFPNGDTQGYVYPHGYVSNYVKSGVFDADCNMMTFYMKPSKSFQRLGGGNDIIQIGTYIRQKADPSTTNQGYHYYHGIDANHYANHWIKYTITRKPTHQVGHDGNTDWPSDPEYASGYIPISWSASNIFASNNSVSLSGAAGTFASMSGYMIKLSNSSIIPFGRTWDVYKITNLNGDNSIATISPAYSGTTGTYNAYRTEFHPQSQPSDTFASNSIHYFEGLTRWYIHHVDPNAVNYMDGYNITWQIDDIYFEKDLTQPDDDIGNFTATYNGSQYELTWSCKKNVKQNYFVYHSTSNLKNADGTYNGAGTYGGYVARDVTPYTSVWWESPSMAEADSYYFFILPSGLSNGTQINLVKRN